MQASRSKEGGGDSKKLSHAIPAAGRRGEVPRYSGAIVRRTRLHGGIGNQAQLGIKEAATSDMLHPSPSYPVSYLVAAHLTFSANLYSLIVL